MDFEKPDSTSLEHLRKEGRLLLRLYQAEFAKDPNGHATETSRSNLMAVQHTVRQVYGEGVALDVELALGQPEKAENY